MVKPNDGAPVILDCGSGYTKMGIAGSHGPSHVIPTVLYRQDRDTLSSMSRSGIFSIASSAAAAPLVCIGNSAIKESMNDVSGSTKPILDGRVTDWSDLEQYIARCYSEFLKVDPGDRPCVLTEPPLNPSRNREMLAEVMFETFGVPSMYIGVQAVLALYAYWDGKSSVTGTVVDSGDGVTHVIPVTDGYVSGASVREIPIAGKDVTRVISDALQARREIVVDNPETAVALNRLAKQIKEKLAYVSQNPMREFKIYDASPSAMFKRINWTDPRSNLSKDCDIGYEQFLGPEVFFQPSLVSSTVKHSLPMILVDSVQTSPIDYRRGLYSNIVLSGGSTMFPNFGSRLEHEVSGLIAKDGKNAPQVNVKSNPEIQRFAVWYGAAALSQAPSFKDLLLSRKEYEERGPSAARDTTITRCIGL
jgi:actin-related protein 3